MLTKHYFSSLLCVQRDFKRVKSECDGEEYGKSSGLNYIFFSGLYSQKKLIAASQKLILVVFCTSVFQFTYCSCKIVFTIGYNYNPNSSSRCRHIRSSRLFEIQIQISVSYINQDKNLNLNALKYQCLTCGSTHSPLGILSLEMNYYPKNEGKTISSNVL